MAVNAASSSYVSGASSNKGFSGLASGVDTESMVEQLLSGTQQKIDKQNALKQQLEWKQEIYRHLISQINAFQTKFFSYSSDSNLLSESFFNSMSAVTSSSAFKATATSSAVTGSNSIEVRRLATKTSLSSGDTVSGKLVGELDKEALEKLVKDQVGTDKDYTVKFQVGSKEVSVNLRDVFVQDDKLREFDSTTQRDAEIQAKLEEAFKDTGVKVSVKDGAMSLVTEGDKRENILLDPTSGKLEKIDYSGSQMAKPDALALFLTELREALEPYGTRISLLLSQELLAAGKDEASGEDLAALLPLVDAVYVATGDIPGTQALLTAIAGEEAPALVPLTAAPTAGNWCVSAG